MVSGGISAAARPALPTVPAKRPAIGRPLLRDEQLERCLPHNARMLAVGPVASLLPFGEDVHNLTWDFTLLPRGIDLTFRSSGRFFRNGKSEQESCSAAGAVIADCNAAPMGFRDGA